MSPDDKKQPFGHRPGERVWRPGHFTPPPVRTRPAPLARAERLTFEPEVEGQKETLARALAQAPAPAPGLAFEPEVAAPPERLVSGPAPGAADAETEGLLDLAAGRAEAAAREPSAAMHQALPSRPSAPRQAEGTPSGLPEGAARADSRPRPMPGVPAPPTDRPPHEVPRRATSRLNWISVFLSEKVAGRRRRRRATSTALRRSGLMLAVAERVAGRWSRRVRRVVGSVDAVTSRARLPLANIFWGAALAGISILLGVAPPWAAGFFAASLILTVAGQSARNLVGFAGIMIAAAALAEIVRQRARFFEVFMDLFG